ncbi:putative membrane protein YuiD-like [Hordeum vulgare]|nr:putative membrane protein YuiD-like [Hordeum vulgare]
MRATEMLTAAAGGAAGRRRPRPRWPAWPGLAWASPPRAPAGTSPSAPPSSPSPSQLRQRPLHLTCRLKEKKWDARKFLISSGIISSLSAAVASLAVAVGQQEGGDSSVFALALVFAAVVMYDASGVRFHTGRQAALLNQIVSDLSPEHPIISTFRPLREPLGHSPFQVFAGALVGCTVAYLMGKSV